MSLLRADFRLEPASCYVDARCPQYKVIIPAERDLSPLLPYLNAVTKVVFFDPEEPVIVFRFEGRKVAVRKGDVRISGVSDLEEGKQVKAHVEAFLEDLWKRREMLTPRYEARKMPSALEIYRHLPQTNCGLCGELSCLAFAVKLAEQEGELSACLPLEEERYSSERSQLKALLEN